MNKKDISEAARLGCYGNGKACAVARAVKRKLDPQTYFHVSSKRLELAENAALLGYVEVKLPKTAIDFIGQFDSKKEVQPIRFRITVPDTHAHLFFKGVDKLESSVLS